MKALIVWSAMSKSIGDRVRVERCRSGYARLVSGRRSRCVMQRVAGGLWWSLVVSGAAKPSDQPGQSLRWSSQSVSLGQMELRRCCHMARFCLAFNGAWDDGHWLLRRRMEDAGGGQRTEAELHQPTRVSNTPATTWR